MNAEYLLDAIGRLDDELVREAERYRRPKARYGLLLGWAASFAVVILLSYGVTHLGMGGGAPSFSGGGNGGRPASGNSAPSAADGAGTPHEPDQPLGSAQTSGDDRFADAGAPHTQPGGNGDAGTELTGGALTISVRGDGAAIHRTFLFQSGKDRVLDELPEGCVEMGRLERLGETEEADVPYTDSEAYVGCPVWLLMEDPETAVLYMGLPEGGYLELR